MRLALRLALLPCVLALVLPAGAVAAKPLEKAIWGPVAVDGVPQFETYRDLDVDVFQIQLRWDRVARDKPARPTDPSDPAYRWPSELDTAVAEARKHRIDVLLLVQGTPRWANQGLEWPQPPDDLREYSRFLTAAARRYPTVHRWMIWGEPLRNINWPGFDRTKPGRLRIAQTYARMLDGAYATLKRRSRRNVVIGGNTFTTDRKPVSWAPVPLLEWTRILRLPNGRPPRMDMWGHNPFTTRIPRLSDPPGAAVGDFSDLDRVIARVRRDIARPLRHRVPIFISEFCLPTGPNPYFPLELTLRRQADWVRRALAIARRQRDVAAFGWWTLADAREATGTTKAQRCGLIDAAGARKPAFTAFRRAATSRR
jgi:hypothetical protein